MAFANAGWPGAIGVVTGLSGRGFAIAVNAVSCPEKARLTGYPVLLHIRRVLEDASGFDDAVRAPTDQKLVTSCLLTVVGTANEQRVVIERSPTRHAHRWGQPGAALIATNDYRSLFQPVAHDAAEIYETTCMRYSALCEFLANHDERRPVEDSALLYMLSDPSVIQTITWRAA